MGNQPTPGGFPATVFCLIPVHNRLDETKTVIGCLTSQDYPRISILIIDDGSTDGTGEFVRQHHPDISIIQGDGSMWWGGAMAAGLRAVLPRAKDDDYVLFQNNDTRFAGDYVSTLVSASEAHGGAVVGSVIKDRERPEVTLSLAPDIDYWKVRTRDLLEVYESRTRGSADAVELPDIIEVDALCGRGTLFPAKVFRRIGGIRSRLLPHYLADHEVSARAKAAGFRTLVSSRAVVWTEARLSGIDETGASTMQTLFDRRSRINILDSIVFFSLCGPWYLRATAPLRVLFFRAWGSLRRRILSQP